MIDFSKITLREKITSRGGGVEIDLTSLGFEGEKMAVYQNYLGGGMLGAIQVNDTLANNFKELDQISNDLMEYFHNLTKHYDDYENTTFEEIQSRSTSAY
jgi:hypothetical protein